MFFLYIHCQLSSSTVSQPTFRAIKVDRFILQKPVFKKFFHCWSMIWLLKKKILQLPSKNFTCSGMHIFHRSLFILYNEKTDFFLKLSGFSFCWSTDKLKRSSYISSSSKVNQELNFYEFFYSDLFVHVTVGYPLIHQKWDSVSHFIYISFKLYSHCQCITTYNNTALKKRLANLIY